MCRGLVGCAHRLERFITAESHGADGHVHRAEAAALLRLVNELGYELVVSNGTRSDLLQADPELRARRERALVVV